MFDKIINKYKLYRLKTILSIIPKYWVHSKKIAIHVNATSRFSLYIDMLKCLMKYGASEENYEQFHFYGSDNAYRDTFITWRRNIDIMYKFNTTEAKALFLNKVEWNKRFAKYIKRDWIYSAESSSEQIAAFLYAHPTVVVKAIEGACGVGIDKYYSKDILENRNLLKQILAGKYIIENEAVNIDVIKEISPASLNTIRVVTCVDGKGNVNIVTTALRVGNGLTFTDNTHSGGLAAMIDEDTGIVMTDGIDFKGGYYTFHPVTKVQFKGFQIPCWKECMSLVQNLALEVPEARFVGWDVVLTMNGIDVLEGNIPPGEDLTQADQIGRYHKVMLMY